MLGKILHRMPVSMLLVVVATLVGGPAHGETRGSGDCGGRGHCVIELDSPGSSGGGGGGRGSDDAEPATGISAGPKKCARTDGSALDCRDGEHGYWSNSSQCYYKLQSPQAAPPSGKSAGEGAWYDCTSAGVDPATCAVLVVPSLIARCEQLAGLRSSTPRWLSSPPPGVNRLTPAQAAAALIRTFRLGDPQIGMSPDAARGDSGAVGLPVWMWVANSNDPKAWGPYTKSATLGGVTITAVARVRSVTWEMGDGESIVCPGDGTVYRAGYGNRESPTCGHRYVSQSPREGEVPYTVTARSNWEVTWTGGGQSGTERTGTASSVEVNIGEIQVVNVAP